MSALRVLPILALSAVVALPLGALAQTTPVPAPAPTASGAPMAHGHHHRHGGFNRALRTLDLSPAQQTQIATFRQQTKQANEKADPQTRRANAAKLRDQILGVLTPDQQAKLKTALAQQHEHGPAPTDSPQPSPAPQ